MFQRIIDYYDDIITRNGDPRVMNFPTMSSPKTMILAVIIYIGFIKIVLSKFMENRKPFELKKIMFYYNIFQVLLSAYLCLEAGVLWFQQYSFWKCNSVDYSNAPLSRRTMMVIYLYYLSKYTEFLDTVFFMLRKKFNQASFLHMYHHASMPVFCWICVKFYGGGSILIGILANTFIHTVMYTYYLIAGMGPQYQKYLWWKKYMTAMQLIQFNAGVFHLVIAIVVGECNISKLFLIIYAANGVFLYLLFSHFYKQQYKSVHKNTNTNGMLTSGQKEKCS